MGKGLAERATAAPQQQDGPPSLFKQIGNMEVEFQRAMPQGAEARMLVRDAQTALRQVKDLAKCEPATVLGALMTCAQLGLRPGVLGQAYVLPFWDNRDKVHKAQLVIGYKGLLSLVYRSGMVETVAARIVYENDEFLLEYGLGADTLIHRPPAGFGDRGRPVAYYAIARMKDGGYAITDPMGVEAMQKHAAKHSKAAKFGPWKDHFDQMALKGLALDTPIPTIDGWSTMGNLEAGDTVFDVNGHPTAVAAVSEIKNLPCYEVTFANGERITCDHEHVWVARIGTSRRSVMQEHTIGDLYAAKSQGEQIVVPVAHPLDTDTEKLPIDPWLLGYWLGNGSRIAASVTCHADDLDEVVERIETSGYRLGTVRPDPRSKAVTVRVRDGFLADLREHGVLGTKRIPAQYRRAAEWQRRELLAGLLDSDGHIDRARGRAHFTSTDRYLTDLVAELAASLGEVVHLATVERTGYGKTVQSFDVSWKPTRCPTTLSRKSANYRQRRLGVYRAIRSIEPVESVPTRCIAVESDTRTYLAGPTMVPTHNTMLRKLCQTLPQSTEIAQAVMHDGAVRADTTPAAVDQTPDYVEGQVIEGDNLDAQAPPPPADDEPPAEADPTPQQRVAEYLQGHGVDDPENIAGWIQNALGDPDAPATVAELTDDEAGRLLAEVINA